MSPASEREASQSLSAGIWARTIGVVTAAALVAALRVAGIAPLTADLRFWRFGSVRPRPFAKMNEQLHLSRPQTPNEPNVATRAHNLATAELPDVRWDGENSDFGLLLWHYDV